MSNTFFTADLHLGHTNILKYTPRPWKTLEEMDEAIISNWNSVVRPDDTVFVIGDMIMLKKKDFRADGSQKTLMDAYKNYVRQLNGKICLIAGNHDSMNESVYGLFQHVYFGFLERTIEGQDIFLCHYPMRAWNGSYHGSWNLFGHVHNRLPDMPNVLQQDVGIDVPIWSYTPVSFNALKAVMIKKRETWNQFWVDNPDEPRL